MAVGAQRDSTQATPARALMTVRVGRRLQGSGAVSSARLLLHRGTTHGVPQVVQG